MANRLRHHEDCDDPMCIGECNDKPKVDITKAKDRIVVRNHMQDPRYAPYCLRCKGLVRMFIVAPFYWRHICGAEHDERAVLISQEVQQ